MESWTVAGVELATAAAGLRYRNRDDLLLFGFAPGSQCAATFTRNAFCAAPVTVARQHLATTPPRYWLINAGNANAGTGARGLADAKHCCAALATLGNCAPEAVLPFSTGVIGEYLPLERLTAALPALQQALKPTGWEQAARAIMTTDTQPKLVRRQCQLGDQTVTLIGIAKGAGMIHPNMATMLAFIATDAALDQPELQRCLNQAVADSFNSITIDGDTSTNDACVLAATGKVPISSPQELERFSENLNALCLELATAIVRDGEGATKLVTVEVIEADTAEEARRVAETIALSPLVKTALYAADPNWGRILAAVGRAGIDALEINKVSIWLDAVCIVANGERAADYREEHGKQVMAQDALTIRVQLGRGTAKARLLTCDLSTEYVRINAEYRT